MRCSSSLTELIASPHFVDCCEKSAKTYNKVSADFSLYCKFWLISHNNRRSEVKPSALIMNDVICPLALSISLFPIHTYSDLSGRSTTWRTSWSRVSLSCRAPRGSVCIEWRCCRRGDRLQEKGTMSMRGTCVYSVAFKIKWTMGRY